MKKGIAVLVLIGILFSCTTDDNNEIIDDLNGKWNLVKVRCFCKPVNLEIGDQIWTFDLSKNTLLVENNVIQQYYTNLDTGTYSIKVTGNKVSIVSIDYDYYFENGNLFLSNNHEGDGPLIEFVKN